MNKNEKMSPIARFLAEEVEKKYYLSFGIGCVILIISFVLIHQYKSPSFTYIQVIFYPLLAYFIFQQVLSGFGFITSYIPIAQRIIKWLTKVSKKKKYDEREVKKWEMKLEQLEKKEAKEKTHSDIIVEKMKKKNEELEEKARKGWSREEIKKEKETLVREREKMDEKKKKLEEKINHERQKINEVKGEHRGKMQEKIIHTQEELTPTRFKLIMIIPLYAYTISGIILSLITIGRAIYIWVTGTFEPHNLEITFEAWRILDLIDEYYKGIMVAISITTFYIIPTLIMYRNPDKDIAPKVFVGTKRKISDWWKRKVTKDTRALLNRQFEDLTRYYYDKKQIIGRALLIPIGIAQFVIAPIGGISIALGVKYGIKRKLIKRYEYIFIIIIAITMSVLLVISFFTFLAKTLSAIHPIVSIIAKLIYITFLIISFVLFMKQPIADRTKL